MVEHLAEVADQRPDLPRHRARLGPIQPSAAGIAGITPKPVLRPIARLSRQAGSGRLARYREGLPDTRRGAPSDMHPLLGERARAVHPRSIEMTGMPCAGPSDAPDIKAER